MDAIIILLTKEEKGFFSAISKNSFFCYVHAGRFTFLFSYSFLASVSRILSVAGFFKIQTDKQ
jgi:hypothetical protein